MSLYYIDLVLVNKNKGRVIMQKIKLKRSGFTIVELLVVIVVIGILAAITIVSYSGISKRAVITGLQSDLSNGAKLLKMYNAEYGFYPNSLDGDNCPQTPNADSRYCLKASNGTTLSYSGIGQSFNLSATKNSIKYRITESMESVLSETLSGSDWVTIGTQTWATNNLNVGTRINRAEAQTNNSIIEKYCYGDIESNCTTYGAFYRWNEAMQYRTVQGSKGICPVGSHIPSDDDWKILEIYLGMTEQEANSWNPEGRGTDQGTKLKAGGSSGLNLPLSGTLGSDGFFDLADLGSYWSSTQAGTIIVDGEVVSTNYGAMTRALSSGYSTVLRDVTEKSYGSVIRCVGD